MAGKHVRQGERAGARGNHAALPRKRISSGRALVAAPVRAGDSVSANGEPDQHRIRGDSGRPYAGTIVLRGTGDHLVEAIGQSHFRYWNTGDSAFRQRRARAPASYTESGPKRRKRFRSPAWSR